MLQVGDKVVLVDNALEAIFGAGPFTILAIDGQSRAKMSSGSGVLWLHTSKIKKAP